MRILITRPVRDARPLSERLRSAGHDPLIESLLKISTRSEVTIDGDAFQAIVVTSANAVHAAVDLGLHEPLTHTRVMAVGAASAEAAREAGFDDVLSADGDLDALTTLCREKLRPGNGQLLYISGAVISGDLKARLNRLGFDVERVELYDAQPIERLSWHIRQRIVAGELDAVLLFSPRSARIWSSLLDKESLTNAACEIRHICLSEAVGEVLAEANLPRSAIIIAETPDQEALVAAIGDSR